MMLTLRCPNGHARKVDSDERAGERVVCDECGHVWDVPEVEVASPCGRRPHRHVARERPQRAAGVPAWLIGSLAIAGIALGAWLVRGYQHERQPASAAQPVWDAGKPESKWRPAMRSWLYSMRVDVSRDPTKDEVDMLEGVVTDAAVRDEFADYAARCCLSDYLDDQHIPENALSPKDLQAFKDIAVVRIKAELAAKGPRYAAIRALK